MPVTIHREEPGIYRSQWEQSVTINEIIDSMETAKSFVDADGIQRYVGVIDLRELTSFPFDVRNLRRVALSDERCLAFVVIKASYTAQLLVQMLNQMTNIEFLVVDDIDEAFEIAHSMLATEPSG